MLSVTRFFMMMFLLLSYVFIGWNSIEAFSNKRLFLILYSVGGFCLAVFLVLVTIHNVKKNFPSSSRNNKG